VELGSWEFDQADRVVDSLKGRKAVVAKLGMDAHWRGAIVVANALREAGMEVAYLGHASAAAIVRAVIEEDAVLLGLSSLSGNHLTECPSVLQGLRESGVDDVAVVLGGTVPAGDGQRLRDMGVDAVFGPGSSLKAIVEQIGTLVAARQLQRQPK
jgi:methylmalonyl-CoA mutase C-terminal domain/subunit